MDVFDMKYNIGDIVEARVTGISNYGFFVIVDDKYNGLVHISEISDKFVKNVTDYVQVKEEILCEVLEIDEEDFKLRLSIKNLNYKLIPRFGKIKDTKDGFKSLQKSLPIWMRDKLQELE